MILVINTQYPLLEQKLSSGDITVYTRSSVGSKDGTSFNMVRYGKFHNNPFACSFQSTFQRVTKPLNFSQPPGASWSHPKCTRFLDYRDLIASTFPTDIATSLVDMVM